MIEKVDIYFLSILKEERPNIKYNKAEKLIGYINAMADLNIIAFEQWNFIHRAIIEAKFL